MSLWKSELFFLSENSCIKYLLLAKAWKKKCQLVEKIYKGGIKFGEFHYHYCRLSENETLFYEYHFPYSLSTNTRFLYLSIHLFHDIRSLCISRIDNFAK